MIKCEKEFGKWTVRLNGMFIMDSWREAVARRIAMAIQDALK